MRKVVAIVLASLMLSQAALASPTSQPVKRYVLPKGQVIRNLKSYTLEEFKVILHIYADYKAWFDQIPQKDSQITNLTELNKNLSRQLILHKEDVKILRGDRDRLYKKWVEENKKRHIAENKPQFGSWIAWGLAAVATATAAVLAGVLIAKE